MSSPSPTPRSPRACARRPSRRRSPSFPSASATLCACGSVSAERLRPRSATPVAGSASPPSGPGRSRSRPCATWRGVPTSKRFATRLRPPRVNKLHRGARFGGPRAFNPSRARMERGLSGRRRCMPKEPNTAETKLIEYLNQAYGKERQLETALQAHIGITAGVKGRDAYAKRLKEHLRETKAQAKNLERRIKKLGGTAAENDLPGPDVATSAANVAVAAAGKLKEAVRGPLHTLRGSSPEDLLVKNAQTELSEEF